MSYAIEYDDAGTNFDYYVFDLEGKDNYELVAGFVSLHDAQFYCGLKNKTGFSGPLQIKNSQVKDSI